MKTIYISQADNKLEGLVNRIGSPCQIENLLWRERPIVDNRLIYGALVQLIPAGRAVVGDGTDIGIVLRRSSEIIRRISRGTAFQLTINVDPDFGAFSLAHHIVPLIIIGH